MVLDNGFVFLAQAFRSAFPRLTYHSHCAKQHVLKTPLAALQVGTPESGVAEVYLFELIKGVDYHQFLNLLNSFHFEMSCKNKTLAMSKQQEEYLSLTDEVQNWIGCDSCSGWFHFECVGINLESLPENFVFPVLIFISTPWICINKILGHHFCAVWNHCCVCT